MGQKLTKAPRGDYDAIVYIDGSHVVAEDADGRVISSGTAGTDDATVFAAVVAAFPSGGAQVVISGTYTADITLSNPLFHLVGAPWAVINGHININNYGCCVENIQTNMLDFNSCWAYIKNCVINNAAIGAHTVDITSDVSSLYRIKFDKCEFYNTPINIVSTVVTNFVNGIKFVDCYMENSVVTLDVSGVEAGHAHRIFDGCYFHSSSNTPIAANYCNADSIINSHFDCAGIVPISIAATISSMFINNCSFNSSLISDLSGGLVGYGKIVYVSTFPHKFNSAFGSSTGTGSEQTIAHGLAAIPTGCKAWITYLVGTRYVTEMIPFDATNVYPTVDNGVAYTWRIE